MLELSEDEINEVSMMEVLSLQIEYLLLSVEFHGFPMCLLLLILHHPHEEARLMAPIFRG